MLKKISSRWRDMTFKAKFVLCTAAAFSLSVMGVELVVEPIIEHQVFGHGFDNLDWHEIPQWIVAAIVLGLLGASVVTR
ncbi:MAG: hypothetical protein LIP18_05905, partial [Planctomycetes bacterium]|nr:hypothetical protein [Planctomycetota bacterium]